MRWKYIIIALLIIAILLPAAGYLFLRTQDFNRYKGLIAKAAKDATGRELTLGGDIHVGLSFWPTLVATDVGFANPSWGSQPEMVRIQRLEVQLSLLRLLTGSVHLKRITILGADLLLETNSSGVGNWEFNPAEDRGEQSLWKIRQLKLDDVHIEDLRLRYHNGQTGSKMQLSLNSLDASREAFKRVIEINLKGEVNGQAAVFSGQTGLVSDVFAGEKFPVDLSGQMAGSTITVKGVVGNVVDLSGIDLGIHASGKNLAEVASAVGIETRDTDAFDVRGRLEGSATALALKEAGGNISLQGVQITGEGSIGDILSVGGINLQIKAAGQNLADVGPLIGESLPETGPFNVSGRLTGSAATLALQEAQARATRRSLQLTLNGSVMDLLALNGIRLDAELSGQNLAEAGPLIGEKLPETGAFTVSGRLTGSAAALSLQEARGKAAHHSLRLALNGSIKDLLTLNGMSLDVELSGGNLAEVNPLIGEKLPETDSFTVSGRLAGSGKALSLQDARGKAAHGSLSLVLNGSVKDLLALSGLNLGVDLSGRNLAEVGPLIGEKLPETDSFTVSGRLAGSTRSLSLQAAQADATHRSLNLSLNGRVKDLLALSGLDRTLHCTGKQLSDAGPMLGASLPVLGKFDVKGHLSGSTEVLEIDGLSGLVDQSDVNGSARVEFRKRPKITAVLKSALIDLTPLLKVEQAEEKKAAEALGRDRGLFSDEPLPFDKLEAVDADITLNARNIRARNAKWEFGRLALKLEEADLRIEKLEAVYKGTKVSGSAFVHPGSPPRVGTKFLVQGFDLGAFLREIEVSEKAKGYLDIAVDVNSKGNSVKTLMEHLDGTVGVVMGKGYLVKYLDWLAQDLTQKVIPFWGQNEKAGVIDCGVVQFDIKDGLAKSHGLVLNTPVSVLIGKGTINLATENIDFLLNPKPKHPSLFSLATKLRVTGTIQNPEVSPDYGALALKGARALSTFLVGPVGLLTPFVNLGARKEHPCAVRGLTGEELQPPAPAK